MTNLIAETIPEWRVTFWFLSSWGWTQLGFAFIKAKNAQIAIMICAQRASKLGFVVDGDTQVEIRPETGDGRL